MEDGSIVQKASRFTLLMQICNNSSFLVPVALPPASNRNTHMLNCLVEKSNTKVLPTEIAIDPFPVYIQTFTHPMDFSHEKYHLDKICSMRQIRNFCTPYCCIWDDKNLCKMCPVVPSCLSHMPCIFLSIYRNRLFIILFQGIWLSIGRIMPRIKG